MAAPSGRHPSPARERGDGRTAQGTAGGRGVKRYQPHILVACLLVLALLTGLRGTLQDALTDLRFRSFPRQASGDIVLVTID